MCRLSGDQKMRDAPSVPGSDPRCGGIERTNPDQRLAFRWATNASVRPSGESGCPLLETASAGGPTSNRVTGESGARQRRNSRMPIAAMAQSETRSRRSPTAARVAGSARVSLRPDRRRAFSGAFLELQTHVGHIRQAPLAILRQRSAKQPPNRRRRAGGQQAPVRLVAHDGHHHVGDFFPVEGPRAASASRTGRSQTPRCRCACRRPCRAPARGSCRPRCP